LGQKTHPVGFRLGVIKDWQARWFAAKPSDYRNLVLADISVRDTIYGRYPDAGISRVEIERGSNDVVITIHTARPGIVIGRGGQRVEELRKLLESQTDKRARLNVQEIRQPDLDAFLVARNIADQLQRRIAFRRALRQAVQRTMQAGAQGVKVLCGGRLGGSDIARKEKVMEGRVPLHTLRADIDYGTAEAATEYGRIGVKVWIYKGEIIRASAAEEEDLDDIAPIEVTLKAGGDTPERESPPEAELDQAPVARPRAETAAAPADKPEAAPREVEGTPDASTEESEVQEPS